MGQGGIDYDLASITEEPIANKVGAILTDHHPLPKAILSEMAEGGNGSRITLTSRDDLEQLEVARWIEEVGTEKVGAKLGATPRSDQCNRDTGCI